jgi:hypothetical protein
MLWPGSDGFGCVFEHQCKAGGAVPRFHGCSARPIAAVDETACFIFPYCRTGYDA